MAHYVQKGSHSKDDSKIQELSRLFKSITSADEPANKRLRSVQQLQKIVTSLQSNDRVDSEQQYLKVNFELLFHSLRTMAIDKAGQLRPHIASLVTSLGRLFCSLKMPHIFFDQFSKLEATPRDFIPFLIILRDFYVAYPDSSRSDITPPLLDALRILLDTATTEESFVMLLSILISIDHDGQKFIKPYLADVIDCILGWRLDSSSSPATVSLIDESLIFFQPLWYEHEKLACSILDQLVTDMRKIFDLPQARENVLKRSSRLISDRIRRFSWSFIAICRSVGSGLLSAPGPDTDAAASVLSTFLLFLRSSVEASQDRDWCLEANRMIFQLSCIFGSRYPDTAVYAADMLLACLSVAGLSETSVLKHVLQIQTEIKHTPNASASADVERRYLQDEVLSLRKHPELAITVPLRELFVRLMKHPADLKRTDTSKSLLDRLIDEISAYLPLMRTKKRADARAILLFNLSVVARLEADPQDVTEAPFAESFNAICKAVAVCPPAPGDPLSAFVLNALFALSMGCATCPLANSTFTTLLEASLQNSALPQLRARALKFLTDLSGSRHAFVLPEGVFRRLVPLISSSESAERAAVAECIYSLASAKSPALLASHINLLIFYCLGRANDRCASVATSFLHVAARLSLYCSWPLQWRFLETLSPADIKGRLSSRRFNRDFLLSWGRSNQPERFFSTVLAAEQPVDLNWLLMESSLVANGEPDSASSFRDAVQSNLDGLLFSVCTQAAQFFVANRLRSHFGGPAQTLEAIEGVVTQLLAEPHRFVHLSHSNQQGPSASGMTLQFVTQLERDIHAASDGCLSISSSGLSAATTSFFRANKKVCLDWFTRMRSKLSQLAQTSGYMSDSVRHGLERVAYLSRLSSAAPPTGESRTLKKEIYQALLFVASALFELKDIDSLDGLLSWASINFKSLKLDFRWLSSLLLHAKGSCERAADSFSNFLRGTVSSEDPLVESGVIACSMEWLLSCFISVSDWEAFAAFTSTLDSEIASSSYSASYIRALIDFDHGDFLAVRERFASAVPTPSPSSFKYRVHSAEQEILDAIASLAAVDDVHSSKSALSSCGGITTSLLTVASSACRDEAGAVRSVLHLLEIVSQTTNLVEGIQARKGAPYIFKRIASLGSNPVDLRHWNMLLRLAHVSHARGVTSDEAIDSCYQKAIKLARKAHNFRYAERLSEMSQLRTVGSPGTVFERTKLLHALNKPVAAISQLWSLLRTIQADPTSADQQDTVAVMARLKFAHWLEQNEKQPSVIDQLSGAISSLRASRSPQRIQVEALIGSSLREATEIGARSARAWFQYANWLYRSGHRTAKQFNSGASGAASETMVRLLTPAEKSRVDLLIGRCNHLKTEDARKQAVAAIVSRVLPRATADLSPEDLVSGASRADDNTMKLFSEAVGVEDASLAHEFISIFGDIRHRVLTPFRLAVDGYLKFLSVNSNEHGRQPNIIATLRVLRLLVKFGSDLRVYDNLTPNRNSSSLAARLAAAPVAPWRGILPQLFARLAHHDEFVRSQVLNLVCRLGEFYAQDVIYSLVAASEPQTLESVRQSIVGHSSTLLTKLEWFVTELRRITFLPDEVALTLLRHILNDVHSRLRTIRGEVSRLETGSDASRLKSVLVESYSTIMRPAVSRLERFLRDMVRYNLVADVPPATAPTKHDIWFVNRHRESVDRALMALRTAPCQLDDLDFVAVPLRDLIKELSKLSKRVNVRLDHVSPELTKPGAGVPVPGVPQPGAVVSAVDVNISVLPTKTKPKKLTLVGSDGNRYSFLLKGKEDLHLDERIMQLLTTVNQFLHKVRNAETRGLRTRHYAVIPLGRTGGLIQWVDEAVPLFTVYSEHQKRLHKSAISGETSTPGAVEQRQQAHKPIDLFYAKLMPALKAAGIAESNLLTQARPTEVLKQVYLELEKDIPRDLLEREVWLSCADSSEWWQKTNSFSRSTAVMSMVGYVIGLGDRHLDNILLDFRSGEVVHIDYNVCFEKGLKLRIPEVVPFRLTTIMQRALGIAGLDGPFRVASEITLGVMRQNREPLMTLLEAFVYDPVVDWTTSEKIQAEERSMELDVAFTLLLSRTGLVDDPSDTMKKFWECLDELEQSTSRVFTVMEPFFGALQTAASEIETRSAVSIQRSQLHVEMERIRTVTCKSTESSERLRQDEIAAQSFTLNLLADCAAFCEDTSAYFVGIENTFTSLLSSAPKAALAPFVLTTASMPRTLSQRPVLAALKLSDSFISRCIEKDQQMFELNSNRESVLRQMMQLLEAYRLLITEACSPSSYLQSSPSFAWLSLSKNLKNFDFQEVADVVRRLADKSPTAVENVINSLRTLHSTMTDAENVVMDLRTTVSEAHDARATAETRVRSLKESIHSQALSKTDPHAQLRTCCASHLVAFQSELDIATTTPSFLRIVDKSAFLCFLMADSSVQVDPQQSAILSTCPVIAFYQEWRRIEQVFADMERVVLPELMKASRVRDSTFLSCASELASIFLTIQPVLSAHETVPSTQPTDLLHAALANYSKLLEVSRTNTLNPAGGHILLAACDKLFDSTLDYAGFSILRDVMQLGAPYSAVFSDYDLALHQMQLEKIRAICALFQATADQHAVASPIRITHLVRGIKTSYLLSLTRIISSPVFKLALRQTISLIGEPSGDADLSLLETIKAAADSVADYNTLSQLLDSSSLLLSEQEHIATGMRSEWRQFQLFHDNILQSLDPPTMTQIAPLIFQKEALVVALSDLCSRMSDCASEISTCEQAYFSCETEALRAVHSTKNAATKSFQEGVVARRQAQRSFAEKGNAVLSLASAIVSYEKSRIVQTYEIPICSVLLSYVETTEASIQRKASLKGLEEERAQLSSQLDELQQRLLFMDASQKSLAAGKSASSSLHVSLDVVESASKLAGWMALFNSTCIEIDSVLSPICRITDKWFSPGIPHIHSCARRAHAAMQRIKSPADSVIRIATWVKHLAPNQRLTLSDVEHIADNILPLIQNLQSDKVAENLVDEVGHLKHLLQACIKLASEWLHGSDIEDEEADSQNPNELEDTATDESRSAPASAIRNQTALSLLRRVKQKLEGAESLSQEKLSIVDQVSQVIGEAISIDNLCRMYEGWTAWI